MTSEQRTVILPCQIDYNRPLVTDLEGETMATGTQLEKSAPVRVGQPQLADRLAGLWGLGRVRWAGMQPAQRVWALARGGAAGGADRRPVLVWTAHGLARLSTPISIRRMRGRRARFWRRRRLPIESTANGTGIEVPAAQLDKARLVTAAKGGVKSGRLGFEIFDKPNWVGSEFDEQVNYQRALEGELEHTVGSLSDVESARVHLVLPHDSLFRDAERPAKASVVIKLRHRSLADGEPEAIRNLVASAVDGLTPERVVLVDAAGHLPLGPKTAEAMRAERRAGARGKADCHAGAGDGGRQRARLGHPGLRSGGHRGDRGELRSGSDGDLSMQRTEQTAGTPAGGRRSSRRRPRMRPTRRPLPVYPQQSTAPQTAKTESGTYGASKTVRHVIENPGQVRRMTAAIVVNDRLAQAASKGKAAVWQPRSAEELRNLTALAQAAVGFDPARGDLLTVEDLAFDENRSRAAGFAAGPGAGDGGEFAGAGQVCGAAGRTAGGGGLRRAAGPAPRRCAAPQSSQGHDARSCRASAAAAARGIETSEPAELDPERVRAQEIFEQVTEHLKREPTQSSRLLQSWIHSD